MERFTVREYSGAVLRRRLGAERAEVLPKRAGPLSIGAVRELVLTGVRLELFLDAASPRSPGAPSGGMAELDHGAFAVARGGQRVAGASFRGFEGSVQRGEEVLLRVVAERGSVDARSGGLELVDVTIEHRRAGRTFRAHRARWGRDAMEVPGLYQVGEGERVTAGRGLRIELAEGPAAP